ncbi:porin family protein [Pontimicrobium sp. IMCC45349]|uniref:porin family protein n=1 Tax=Pontimicrobium sp. IMCC45349 TaxID=3391574 RepID=UPI0039A2B5EC
MKKLLLVAVMAAFTFSAGAQGFSAKAGFNSLDFEGFSESGFYIGAGYEFEVSETLDVEPSVLYSAVDNLNSLYIPVMLKYNISEDFNLQAGPQVNYILEDIEEGEFGLDIAAGAGYNITEQFFVEARYGIQVSRDVEGELNTLTIGVGYRF